MSRNLEVCKLGCGISFWAKNYGSGYPEYIQDGEQRFVNDLIDVLRGNVLGSTLSGSVKNKNPDYRYRCFERSTRVFEVHRPSNEMFPGGSGIYVGSTSYGEVVENIRRNGHEKFGNEGLEIHASPTPFVRFMYPFHGDLGFCLVWQSELMRDLSSALLGWIQVEWMGGDRSFERLARVS